VNVHFDLALFPCVLCLLTQNIQTKKTTHFENVHKTKATQSMLKLSALNFQLVQQD